MNETGWAHNPNCPGKSAKVNLISNAFCDRSVYVVRMADDILKKCICRQLLEFGIADALENADQRDQIFTAMQACLDKSLCIGGIDALEPSADTGATTKDGKPSRRKRDDRRSGVDRRQVAQDWPADKEQRSGKERRSGGDRRGLLEGEQYTPQEAFLNLKAWCNGQCKGTFELSLDTKTGELKFHFDDPEDQAHFMKMLKLFKGMSGQSG